MMNRLRIRYHMVRISFRIAGPYGRYLTRRVREFAETNDQYMGWYRVKGDTDYFIRWTIGSAFHTPAGAILAVHKGVQETYDRQTLPCQRCGWDERYLP